MDDEDRMTGLEFIAQAGAYWVRSWQRVYRTLGYDAAPPQRVKDLFTDKYLENCYLDLLDKYGYGV